MSVSESATYLNGTISVKRRSDDYMAWRIGDTALWALGSSPREAIGNLVMTHPDEIVAAALAARPDRDALEAEVERLREALANVAEGYHAAHQIEDRRLSGAGAVDIDDCTNARCVLALAATDRTAPAERRGGEAT